MNNNIKNAFTKTLLAVGIASASTVTQAASFQLIEQSASGQGAAYAGAAAIGEDASTVYFNPAAMTRLSGQQIVVAGHIIVPSATFTDTGTTDALGTPMTGPNSSTGEPTFVPNFYYTIELPNEFYFGVGVNVPFGLSTEYDDGWIGRYHATTSEIMSVNINPSLAWKATEKVSVGFGVSIQYIDLELNNNIDSYGACINLANQSGGTVTGADCVNAGLTGFAIASQDSSVKLAGDSLELGWNAGLLIDIDDKNRLGIAYRSAIKHNVSGDATYNLDPRLQPFADGATQNSGFNILQTTTLEATASLPESFSVSYAGEVTDKWTALVDWTWTGWSNLDVITIRQAGGVPGQEPALDLQYKNSNRFSVGAHYQHNDKLVYRGGLALDQTPIRSPETLTARIPGNDRLWLSLGAGYDMSASWTFDFGYSHLFIDDTEINNSACASSCSNATLVGTYESSVDIFSAQATYNF